LYRFVVASLLTVGGLVGPAFAECDAKSEIEAAFNKQQKSPAYRSVVVTQSEGGQDEQTFDYIPPDKMHRKITAHGDPIPLETIGIGRWAWSNASGPWSELEPQVAQMVAAHLEATLLKPRRVTADFICLGKVSFEGKDYLGYQTVRGPADGADGLVRTIYIDPATGLPAFNIVGKPDPGTAPVVKESYSYPADIVIEAPVN
jgi:hypothetical protein